MKTWLPAILIVFMAAYLLVQPMRTQVMPRMIRTGTEQIIAQWRDAMLAYKADHGSFPPSNLAATKEDSWINALHRENSMEKLYIDKYSVRVDGVPVDGWGKALFFDYDHNGDLSNIRSAGPDGKFGTSDDIAAKDCPQRNIPVPDDLIDAQGRRKKEAQKKADSKSDAPDTSAPDPKANPAGKPAPPSPAKPATP